LEILENHKGRRVDAENTICEVHRRIADLLVCRLSDRPEVLMEILPEVNKGFLMGKRLVLALIEKKISLPQWEMNNVNEAVKLRHECNRLVKELHEAGHSL